MISPDILYPYSCQHKAIRMHCQRLLYLSADKLELGGYKTENTNQRRLQPRRTGSRSRGEDGVRWDRLALNSFTSLHWSTVQSLNWPTESFRWLGPAPALPLQEFNACIRIHHVTASRQRRSKSKQGWWHANSEAQPSYLHFRLRGSAKLAQFWSALLL